MNIQLYELTAADGRLFSPPCWRTRLSLEWRGLKFDSVPTCYTEIKEVAEGRFTTVPIFRNESIFMADSWEINKYLDTTYAAKGKIFRNSAEEAQALFIQQLMLVPRTLRVILLDLFKSVAEKDKEYFRVSREKRFNMTLEEANLPRAEGIEELVTAYQPFESYFSQPRLLGGDHINYADIIVLSHLQLPIRMGGIDLLQELPAMKGWVNLCAEKLPSLKTWVT